jgi:outer membrane usher protein
MRRLLALLLAVFALVRSVAAMAADLPPVSAPPPGAPLFVELVVNGRSSGDIVPLTLAGGRMLVAGDVLRKAGLTVGGDGEQDLAHLPGIQARYDAALQSLAVDASPDLMPLTHVAGEQRDRAHTIADWGAMLNYDAYAQRAGRQTSASLWTEQRLFGPLGVLSNNGTLRVASGRGGHSGYLRYDTDYRFVDEGRALTLTAGDFISRSLPWSTSVRMGGVQIARDFAVRPDLLTMPLPSFAGKTAVPTAVDLFVNGYRQQSSDVAPGRFVLDNIPVVNGAGEATIVTTDAVGRQIATTIPFYVSSSLLKPGLLDVAGEIGMLRRNYGLKSFDYGALAASGTVRRGLTRSVTVEAHGEASAHLALAGAGLVWAPGRLGTFSLSAGASRTAGRTDGRWSAGYNYTARRVSLAYQHDENGSHYRDLGSFDLADYAGSRRSDRFIASVNVPHQGSVAVAYIGGRTLTGLRSRIATVSYSRPLGHGASLFLSADHDFGRHATSAQLRLVVPFGRNSVGGGISRSAGRGALAQVDVSHAMPSSGGIGVDASLAANQNGNVFGQGTATWRTDSVQFQAGAAVAQGSKSAWVSATGSLVTMDRDLFLANQVSDAFAVVSTGGVKGVGVSYENQPAGVTDAKGHLFVPNVVSYMPTRFAIDTLSLTADHVAASVEQRVAFQRGVGALIRMPIKLVRNVVVRLAGADGKPLAPGGRVARAGAPDTEIGWDGIAYLEDVGTHLDLAVTRRDGATCHAVTDVPATAKTLARIGPVPCV